MLEDSYTMPKLVCGLLTLIFLTLSLISCANQAGTTPPIKDPTASDTVPPTLLVVDGNDLESKTSSIVIQGQLSDNVGVTSFTYSYSDGVPQNILSSLRDGKFSFTLNDLSEATPSTVVLVASDAAGNTVATRIYMSVVPFFNVEGRWQDLALDYTVCTQSYKGKILLELSTLEQDGSLLGSGEVILNKQAASLYVDATVSNDDIITGDVVITRDNKYLRGSISLNLKGKKRLGYLSIDNWPCPNGSGEQVIFNTELAKDNTFSIEEFYEPNNQPSDAVDVFLPYIKYGLSIKQTDQEDWFKFSLSEQQVVSGSAKPTQPFSQTFYDITFYTKDLTKISPSNSFGSMLLDPGVYYVKIAASEQASYTEEPTGYDLEIRANQLPDKQYEPNQNREQAREYIISDQYSFKTDGMVTNADEDWFAFRLYTSGTVTLIMEALAGIEFTFYQDNAVLSVYNPSVQPVKQTLEAGTYYLCAVKKDSHPFVGYGLSVSMN
jgi:hypothetical protein